MIPFALFGAAGAIGASIAAALRAASIPYRVVGRSRAALQQSFGDDPLAEIVAWNPDDPSSVRAAAQDVETIIYLVGVPYTDFHLHPVVLQKTLDGAIAAGVRQIILIGTLYPFGRSQTATVNEDHPREPHTFKGRMRKEQEDVLLAAHASGRIRGAILRLPDFYGPNVERSFLHNVFSAIATGKRAQMVGPIDQPHEFVFVPDVGPVVLKLAQKPDSYGRAWNLGGAGTITQREFARRAFAAAGQKPRLVVAEKWMLRLMGIFNPFLRELVEMHYLFSHPLTVDDNALHELLGAVPKTSYDEGIKRCLAALPSTASR